MFDQQSSKTLDEMRTKGDNAAHISTLAKSTQGDKAMKTFLLLPLLALLVSPALMVQTPTPDGNQIAVLSFKWSRTRQTIDTPAPERAAPAPAMIQDNKNLERNARANDPAGVRDPNQDTVDGRSAALEKSVQSAEKPPSKTVDTFAYQAKIHNASKQVVEIVFWEYQFVDPANPGNVTRRQFLCGVNIKPDKDKELQGFSLSGPTSAVNVSSLANASANPFQEKVVINRVEFADGKSWMRKDWNAGEIKAAYQRAIATPWSPNEMCRAL